MALTKTKKIKVLVIDDSAVIRQILSKIIDSNDDMEVVGTAADPYIARDKIKHLAPDVLTLDVEMPRMDGITFLKNIMRLRPMPVIMISTLTEAGADITLEALQIGAFDYLPKPKENVGKSLADYERDIVSKIRAAAGANLQRLELTSQRSRSAHKDTKFKIESYSPKPNQLIAIGASTGGTEAIKEVLLGLPANCPPVVVTQHIPPQFSTSYAMRMNNTCSMTVHEAKANQKLLPGNVYIAPGDQHLTIQKTGSGLITQLAEGEKVNRHRPSVEVMFDSITGLGVANCIGVLLTGMGADGAQALLRMKQQGYHTIIQDEATSVVWGMPGAAFQLNAYNEVKPLESIAGRLLQLTGKS
jgi:two-component system chemotaxis response regulator CheB